MFDEFLKTHEAMRGGSRISSPREFFDAKQIDPYVAYMVESGAIDGEVDADRRLKEVRESGSFCRGPVSQRRSVSDRIRATES
jgi:hypothetical protein